MVFSPYRAFITGVSVLTFLISLLTAFPAEALSSRYRWDWDIEWLRETQGGFADEYLYDPSLFYYTLPSRARSFALHPYHRQNYYKTYHIFPPPPDYEQQLTPQELAACGNYTFSRPDRVPPFGYECR
jgi:hypothetical protein